MSRIFDWLFGRKPADESLTALEVKILHDLIAAGKIVDDKANLVITASDFPSIPMEPPRGLLRGYRDAERKENILSVMLVNALEWGDLTKPYDTKWFYLDDMVDDGLVKVEGHMRYQLTPKAIGMLFLHYSKNA